MGRVLLPAKIRRQLSIGAGSELVMTVEAGKIALQTRERALRDVQDRIAQLVPPGVSLAGELIRERRQEVERED
jgi:AbrB family looped-hinge helix DNA binding protein